MDSIKTTKISGSGSLDGGTYGSLHISGSGRLNGNIDCYDFHCSGSAHAYGSIHSKTEIHCSGSFTCDGDIRADKSVHCSGSVKAGGALHAESVCVSGVLSAKDSVCAEELKVSGSLLVGKNAEAETIKISGGCKVEGNLNGESIELCPSGTNMHITTIGGSLITVKNAQGNTNLLMRLIGQSSGKLICELIEGDTVSLVHTECKVLRGKNITLGTGCKIDKVEYSESLEAAPDAVIGESEQV